MKCDLYLMLYHQKLYYLYCVFLMNVHRYIKKCLCCIHVKAVRQQNVRSRQLFYFKYVSSFWF